MIVEGPGGIRIEFPDNTDRATIDKVMREAIQSRGATAQEPKPEQRQPTYWGSSSQAVDTLTMGASTKGGAAMTALLDATLNAIKGGDFNYSQAYDKNLASLREDQRRYNEESPIMARAADVGGLAIGAARLPVIGSGWLGAAATGGAYGATGGALQDANTLYERLMNTLKGAGAGGLIGTGGYGAGKAISWGLDKTGKAINALRLPPDVRAASEIAGVADDRFGPFNAMSMDRELSKLGPDAVRVDALGEPGRAAARRAANVSPEARETLETFATARKGNQNVRLVGDAQKAGGVPQGSRLTVEELKREAYKKVKPQIDAAYTAARKAGAEIPLELFDNIITTPVGAPVFREALDIVTSRAARNPSAGGNLAVLDETKRLLDGKATEAFRRGDPMGSVYAETAEALRQAVDGFLARGGDQYAVARGLRQQAFKADEAFDIGEELAQRNVSMDAPKRAAKVKPENSKNVAAAYSQTKAQRLLNNNNTEAAMTEFTTPMGRDASKAALGAKAADIDAAIEREKLFNALNKALGNSTTARQLIEAGGSGVVGAGIGGYLSDFDPFTMGVSGVLSALARRTAPKVAQKITSQTQMRSAPEVAKLLTGKGALPSGRVAPPNAAQRLSKIEAEAVMKALLLELQKNSPQTNRAQ